MFHSKKKKKKKVRSKSVQDTDLPPRAFLASHSRPATRSFQIEHGRRAWEGREAAFAHPRPLSSPGAGRGPPRSAMDPAPLVLKVARGPAAAGFPGRQSKIIPAKGI